MMTNKEKFEEVFGFTGNFDGCCFVPCPPVTLCSCCEYNDWGNKEYKPLHPDQDKSDTIRQLREEIDRIRDANERLHDERFDDGMEIIKLKRIITEMAIKFYGGNLDE